MIPGMRVNWKLAGMVGAAMLVSNLSGALAQNRALVDASDETVITEFFRGFGTSRLGQDDVGDPQVTGRMDGIGYVVYFYGCDAGKNCKSIQIRAGWTDSSVTIDEVNAWNLEKRFSKAYLDADGDPVVEMSINMAGGLTAENFNDTIDWWRVMATTFRDEVVNQ